MTTRLRLTPKIGSTVPVPRCSRETGTRLSSSSSVAEPRPLRLPVGSETPPLKVTFQPVGRRRSFPGDDGSIAEATERFTEIERRLPAA